MLVRCFVFLSALLFVASPTVAAIKEYGGEAGGYLIYSSGVGGSPIADFEFPYKRIAAPDGRPVSDWRGKIEPKLGGAFLLKVANPDFTGFETGHVVVRRLPPGRYEIAGFKFGGQSAAGGGYIWTSNKPISQAFEIRAGEATYVGSFFRAMSNAAMNVVPGGGTYFIVGDRAARDLPLARNRIPAGTKISVEVTDVRQFDTPALRRDIPAAALDRRICGVTCPNS